MTMAMVALDDSNCVITRSLNWVCQQELATWSRMWLRFLMSVYPWKAS